MTRKPPYKHPVSSYTRRDGKRIDNYERGKGKKPKQNTKKNTKIRNRERLFNVSVIGVKGSDLYRLRGFSFSDAAINALHNYSKTYPMKLKVRRVNVE